MTAEQWMPIPGWEGRYSVSSEGRLRGEPLKVRRGPGDGEYTWPSRPVSQYRTPRGYMAATLYRGNKSYSRRVHRLVLEAFVGPCPDGMEARHLDGNPTNNRLENLAWGSHQENEADKRAHGTAPTGERGPGAKLNSRQVAAIRHRFAAGERAVDLAAEFGIHWATLYKIARRQSWQLVGDEQPDTDTDPTLDRSTP